MTSTRCARPRISSSSDEIEQDPHALGGERDEQLVDRALGADVDAAGRLVGDQDARLAEQHAREEHLLLVAAGERPRPAPSRARRARRSGRAPRRAARRSSRGGRRRARAERRASRGERHVLDHRAAEDEAVVLARLRDHREAARARLRRGLLADASAPDASLTSAALDPVGAEDRARELGAAGADEAGEADDLARADVEGDVVDAAARAGRAPRGRRARPAARRLLGGNVEVERRGRASPRSSESSVSSAVGAVRTTAPSRRTVTVSASVEHLAQEVRDQDDRRAAPRRGARMIACSCARLGRVERRRRLVHDDDLAPSRAERPQDLDLLLLGGPQAAPAATPPGRSKPAVAASSAYARRERRRARNRAGRGSAPRKTFSATVSCGTIDGSWAIAAMPRSSASRGDRNETGAPSRSTGRRRRRARRRRSCRASTCRRRSRRRARGRSRGETASGDAVERPDAAEALGDVQELEMRALRATRRQARSRR